MYEMLQDTIAVEHADGIPPGLDDMEPGHIMAAFVSAIDVDSLSGYDRVVVLRAHSRLAAHFSAQSYRDMAAIKDVMHDYDHGSGAAIGAATEIRAALRLTRRMADIELEFALDLRQRLPQVWDMLQAGTIDVRRAKLIVDATIHLSIGTAQDVVRRVADVASEMTTGELGAHIRGLCIDANPTDAEEVYERSVADRHVAMEPDINGTAHLKGYDLPPDRVLMATERINRLAKGLRIKGETRTIDQLRADVYLDLLSGVNIQSDGATAPRTTRARGGVTLRVDVDTLAALNDHPGELAGYGPVIADIARQFAESNRRRQWQWSVTDTESGQPIATGTTRRRPTAQQRRNVEAFAPTCVFPGCRVAAVEADIDHRTPYSEDGSTDEANLSPLCRHDHGVRHEFGWTYSVDHRGVHDWRSPFGHSYEVHPNTSGGTPP
jgi:hypothetical protein